MRSGRWNAVLRNVFLSIVIALIQARHQGIDSQGCVNPVKMVQAISNSVPLPRSVKPTQSPLLMMQDVIECNA
jgi:hypothetical protein